MATNLSIDPALLELALHVSGERTKKAAVTRALEEFVARRKQKRLLDLMASLNGNLRLTTKLNDRDRDPVCRYKRLVSSTTARRTFANARSTSVTRRAGKP